jgi:predicted transcriptional regulator
MKNHLTLSRRERQIMDIVYEKGGVTVSAVRNNLSDPPSYSAVRALLSVLEKKGHLKHRVEGQRYVYFPVIERIKARRSALRHVVKTFFDGSVEDAVATLIDVADDRLTDEEFERLSQAIAEARQEET